MVVSGKKLLVLDVNGLLIDTYFQGESRPDHPHDAKVNRFYVYKRPFCNEFLEFCLENFLVGIWSSAKAHNVYSLVEFMFKEAKEKLAFIWHQKHCTDTGFRHPENKYKPVFLKELRKLWEKDEPQLPWEAGDYGPSNTLLIDDSAYKAISNPSHTAIFPKTYKATNKEDDYLDGELRTFLEGLLISGDVQQYIEKNPFGEPCIGVGDLPWSDIVNAVKSENVSKLLDQVHVVGISVPVVVPDTIGSYQEQQRPTEKVGGSFEQIWDRESMLAVKVPSDNQRYHILEKNSLLHGDYNTSANHTLPPDHKFISLCDDRWDCSSSQAVQQSISPMNFQEPVVRGIENETSQGRGQDLVSDQAVVCINQTRDSSRWESGYSENGFGSKWSRGASFSEGHYSQQQFLGRLTGRKRAQDDGLQVAEHDRKRVQHLETTDEGYYAEHARRLKSQVISAGDRADDSDHFHQGENVRRDHTTNVSRERAVSREHFPEYNDVRTHRFANRSRGDYKNYRDLPINNHETSQIIYERSGRTRGKRRYGSSSGIEELDLRNRWSEASPGCESREDDQQVREGRFLPSRHDAGRYGNREEGPIQVGEHRHLHGYHGSEVHDYREESRNQNRGPICHQRWRASEGWEHRQQNQGEARDLQRFCEFVPRHHNSANQQWISGRQDLNYGSSRYSMNCVHRSDARYDESTSGPWSR